MRFPTSAFVGMALAASIGMVAAHDGVHHKTPEEAARHAEETAANTPGFPNVVGGDYRLIDQFGKERSSSDPRGRYQMIFFGYASCKAICSIALPRMAEAADILESQGIDVTPVLITVDRERDTVAAMAEAVPFISAKMIGLTGSEAALDEAYKAFGVEKSLVYVHPDEGPIYAHGSFVYLTGPDGSFKTLMPPVLGPDRMAEIVASYVKGAAGG